jgi:hypothetical protein
MKCSKARNHVHRFRDAAAEVPQLKLISTDEILIGISE